MSPVATRLPTETASAFVPFLDGKRQCAGRFLAGNCGSNSAVMLKCRYCCAKAKRKTLTRVSLCETELEFVSVLHVLLRTFDLELAEKDYDPALEPDVYPILKAPMILRVKRR